ncbi:PaaI family thioesterase [Thiomicrorhabdus xiamenensis]|uniref:PaaI family thioesterase n=1 Tax=Thiomicrorhabdus xiamenensis TaxID=2739063 RepID=A0A7D4NPP1_9GAMM|nr:PaaI family thioesterase [Thiomicrorhabdus xiamenensis]QKI88277.1 PaaI family thioesterase [Thiomicrorhabdus xiamenensis]
MRNIKFPFLEHIGAELTAFESGSAEVELHVKPYHLQHMGFVHGGVISTLMDNTGWYAAVSNLEEGCTAVTMEIKVNYLKPASGKHLLASATVKRKGQKVSFVTIELLDGDQLVAYATGTYAILSETGA